MKTTIYENKDFILIRKPHGIPSTFGKLESFLDKIKNNESEHNFTWTPLSELVPEDIFSFMSSRLGDFQPAEDPEVQLRHQVDTFGEDQEFGLLNRLDNETGGFLYFAKNNDVFHQFKTLQKSEKIQKFYLAQIEWRLNSQSSIFHLQFPIMHHKSNPDKMIVIQNPQDLRFGRSQQHDVSTQIEILHYDEKNNRTTILATITRGIRHQIRVHLASNGTAILGDSLYAKKWEYLHLRSLGFEIKK